MKKVVLSIVLSTAIFSHIMADDSSFKETNRDEVNINFKNLKIADFIKMVAKITGKR